MILKLHRFNGESSILAIACSFNTNVTKPITEYEYDESKTNEMHFQSKPYI
jgi:hypothetical protein